MARRAEVSGRSLADVLGGRTGALGAGLPAVAFVTVWAVAGAFVVSRTAVLWGAGAALLAGVVLAAVRPARGRRPAAVVLWPLLGVIVGLAPWQRTRWRADPDLLRAYSRASWVWVAQYLPRLAVFVPLYRADQVFVLGVARGLTWMPAVLCVALSWPAMRTALPAGHPDSDTLECGRVRSLTIGDHPDHRSAPSR